MKFLRCLLILSALTSAAPAAPYVVYSGTATVSTVTGTKSTTSLILLTDLADSSSFSILEMNPATKKFAVVTRQYDSSPAPTADDSSRNFLGGITASTGKSGTGVLSFAGAATNGGNSYAIHAYGTGPLALKPVTLAPARIKPLVVALKNKFGSYTFNPATAVTSGNTAFPTSLSGIISNQFISGAGSVDNFSLQGTFTLKQNAPLTSLANIGGAYAVGRNNAAMLPITPLNGGFSELIQFPAWLSALGEVNGCSGPVQIADDVSCVSTLPFGVPTTDPIFRNDVGLVLDGSMGGSSTIALPGGTLKLTTVNPIDTRTYNNLSNGIADVYAFMGIPQAGIIFIPNELTYIHRQVPSNPGATYAVIVANGSSQGYTHVLGLGELTPSPGPNNLLAGSATAKILGCTITVTAVNNGLVDGTITGPFLNSFSFTGVDFFYINADIGATFAPGDIISGNVMLESGTLIEATATNYTDTGSLFLFEAD